MDRKPSGTWAPMPGPRNPAWEEATRGKDLRHPIPYDPHRAFSVGEVIAHHKFGIGVVVGLREGKKIHVVFKSRYRLLVHGLK